MAINDLTRVLIVDDSKSICRILEKHFSEDPGLEVVGYALDAYEARDKINQLKPDVITLDVQMPRMDGVTFLRNLMRLKPMPVVMLSSLTSAGAEITFDALEAGAVDFMHKVQPGSREELHCYMQELIRRIKQAGSMKLSSTSGKNITTDIPDLSQLKNKLESGRQASPEIHRLLAIGASTGGPEALRHVLTDFDAKQCAIVIAQHMPENFMAPFALRLHKHSTFEIALAVDGEKLKPGCAYVAPGNQHLTIIKRNMDLYCQLNEQDPVNGHRPSVDVLFNSVAESVGVGATGLLLTGMGNDGAVGLTRMCKDGSLTLVQDELSSSVWGMPRRAYEMGGADCVLSLQAIAPVLNKLFG
ncbi:MAG: chemotaxis response regulator protein-glutamate methylesterase [Granulosicoccus sp.]